MTGHSPCSLTAHLPDKVSCILKSIKYNKLNIKSNNLNVNLGKAAPELPKSAQAADEFGPLIFRGVHKHANAKKNVSY